MDPYASVRLMRSIIREAATDPELLSLLVALGNRHAGLSGPDRFQPSDRLELDLDEDEWDILIAEAGDCPRVISVSVEQIAEAAGIDRARFHGQNALDQVKAAAHERIVYGVSSLLEERGL